MDSRNFSQALEHLASSGIVLSTEQRTALQASLPILKNAERFFSVVFWGRISAVARDYFIAQGVRSEHTLDRKTFYSTDCVTWAQLPEVHPIIAASATRIQTQFTGNASHEYTVHEPVPGPDEPAPPADIASLRSEATLENGHKVIATIVSEEKRLAAVVAAISHDVAVAPRGAFRLSPSDKFESSRAFEGLSSGDAGKLANYVHLRPAINLPKKPITERVKLDKTLDFMDPLTEDVPSVSWSLQLERGSSVAILRSLLWPGFVGYHVPETAQHGYLYSGTGTKNFDLAFMIP